MPGPNRDALVLAALRAGDVNPDGSANVQKYQDDNRIAEEQRENAFWSGVGNSASTILNGIGPPVVDGSDYVAGLAQQGSDYIADKVQQVGIRHDIARASVLESDIQENQQFLHHHHHGPDSHIRANLSSEERELKADISDLRGSRAGTAALRAAAAKDPHIRDAIAQADHGRSDQDASASVLLAQGADEAGPAKKPSKLAKPRSGRHRLKADGGNHFGHYGPSVGTPDPDGQAVAPAQMTAADGTFYDDTRNPNVDPNAVEMKLLKAGNQDSSFGVHSPKTVNRGLPRPSGV